MSITCCVCRDLIVVANPDEKIFATKCGHIFHYTCLTEWLGRSKSCPQCREKTSEKSTFRLYFGVAEDEFGQEDPVFLKNRVDSLEFSLKLREKEIHSLNKGKDKLSVQTAGLRAEIKDMQGKVRSSEQAAHSLRDELKTYKNYCKQVTEIKLENEELKKQVTTINSVDLIINGSTDEADCIIENTDLEVEHLRLCVKHFKRRIKELENEYRSTESERVIYRKKNVLQKKHIEELQRKNDELNVQLGLRSAYTPKKTSSPAKSTQESVTENLMKNNMEREKESNSSHSLLNYKMSLKVSHPNPLYMRKNISANVAALSSQLRSLPKTVMKRSNSTASGDDVFHPTKYPNTGKVDKTQLRKKKKLCVTAVNSVGFTLADYLK